MAQVREHATLTLDDAAWMSFLIWAVGEQPMKSDVMTLCDVMEALDALSVASWKLLPPASAADALRTTCALHRST
jgi:hypothetical protein